MELNDAVCSLFTAFSSWDKLKKVVVWILIMRSNLRNLAEKRKQLVQQACGMNNERDFVDTGMKQCKLSLRQQYANEQQRQRKVNEMLDDAEMAIIRCVQRLYKPQLASAMCERLFSYAGHIFTPRHATANSSDTHFENQLLLK
jgi:MarR-like DNA-binding transcriptional regulator SgrR of sgrS sRNA